MDRHPWLHGGLGVRQVPTLSGGLAPSCSDSNPSEYKIQNTSELNLHQGKEGLHKEMHLSTMEHRHEIYHFPRWSLPVIKVQRWLQKLSRQIRSWRLLQQPVAPIHSGAKEANLNGGRMAAHRSGERRIPLALFCGGRSAARFGQRHLPWNTELEDTAAAFIHFVRQPSLC